MRALLLPSLLLVSAVISAQGERSELRPDPVGTRLLDLDGDGALDLLVQHGDGSLLVRRNAGPRRFLDVVQELPRVTVTDVLCGDLDGDAQPDLYLVSPGADVALLGLGDGRFREATEELGLSESGAGIRAERLDVDGDGLLDLVLHNQGSDVLFWARADGRFERELGTADGPPADAVPGGVMVLPPPAAPGAEGAAIAGGDRSSGGLHGSPGGSGSTLGLAAAPVGPSSPEPIMGISFDARYVNDNQNEVDSADVVDGSLTGAEIANGSLTGADILDGSLTGADVSTSSGNVTFGGGATVTARKGVFGFSSAASGLDSTVSGGAGNAATGNNSTVSGGYLNSASEDLATVSGGYLNHATGSSSTVSGGSFNDATGSYSTVAGGAFNDATGSYSTVAGGSLNTASGDWSFAAGRRAKANHQGAFVWGDSASVDKNSSAVDQFNVYAEGGACIFAVGQTTPSMVVAADGRVGIGTTGPSELLTVQTALGSRGFVQRADTVAVGSYANGSGGWYGTFSNHDLIFFVNNSFGDAVLTAAGDFGIGTLSPSFKLEVNGSAGKPGGGSWSTSSDRRLKQNIRDLEGALDTLLELRGVTFEYKDPDAVHELSGTRIGFIAQEVEEVLPDWVEEIGGYKRLTVRGFEALAVEALRELRDENAELRAANETLGARVTALEGLESKLSVLESALAALAAR